jgi:hypothetical protein
MSLAVVLASGGVFFTSLLGGAGSLAEARPLTVPVTEEMTLEEGAYIVYVVDSAAPSALRPEDVTVVSDSGTAVPVRARGVSETIENNSGRYRSVAGFTTPAAGSYTVTVQGTPGTSVIILATLFGALGTVVASVVVGVAGGLGILLGVVLVVVGFIRGRR